MSNVRPLAFLLPKPPSCNPHHPFSTQQAIARFGGRVGCPLQYKPHRLCLVCRSLQRLRTPSGLCLRLLWGAVQGSQLSANAGFVVSGRRRLFQHLCLTLRSSGTGHQRLWLGFAVRARLLFLGVRCGQPLTFNVGRHDAMRFTAKIIAAATAIDTPMTAAAIATPP